MSITVALLSIGALTAQVQEVPMTRIYVGTYTSGESEGIYQLSMDPQGKLENLGLAAKVENPSFLARHPALPVVYAVGEMGDGGKLSAFRIGEGGILAPMNDAPSGGSGPCHVAVSRSGSHVAVANYGSGHVALYHLEKDGAIGEMIWSHQHEGKSVNASRQEGPHAHSVDFNDEGTRLFSADLGADKVFVYDLTLPTPSPQGYALPPGAGPRHLAIHPAQPWVYSVNELNSTVTAFKLDAASGALAEFQHISTLPADFSGDNSTAEIMVHPSGKWLYASNRGHDSIAVFQVDASAGTLSSSGHTSTGGNTPRNFSISHTGHFLLAANQNSHTVWSFAINQGSGALEHTGFTGDVPSPVCVLFIHQR